LILAILLLATAGLAGFLWLHWNATPPELVSLPPARSASTDHPDHSKGLRFLSSGFLLQVDGQLYAVTAAHSLIDFRGQGMPTVIPIISLGGSGLSLQIETEGGDWGRPRLGRDLRVDYALFVVNQTIDPEWILHPDSRGKAEIGERVWLNSGLGCDGRAVWTLDDEWLPFHQR
jgi:hypothetical protein